MSIGGFSQCEKLSKCKVANEHRRVLGVVISLLITKIFIIMEKEVKEVFVIFENSNYNFSYLASSGFNSSDLIKSHLNQIHFVDNKKATAKCIECIVK